MAAIDFSRAPSAHTGFTGRFGQFFLNIGLLVQTWNARRATRAALGKLTAKELDDIGLMQADIDTMEFHSLIR